MYNMVFPRGFRVSRALQDTLVTIDVTFTAPDKWSFSQPEVTVPAGQSMTIEYRLSPGSTEGWYYAGVNVASVFIDQLVGNPDQSSENNWGITALSFTTTSLQVKVTNDIPATGTAITLSVELSVTDADGVIAVSPDPQVVLPPQPQLFTP